MDSKTTIGKKVGGAIVSGLLVLGLFFLILEIGLRVIPTPAVSWFQFRTDPKLGLVLNQTNQGVHAGQCFITKGIHFNRFGFRDKERSFKKTSKRILLLGDSFLEGFTVSEEDNFRTRLEQDLGIETISLARRGFGIGHSLAMYELLGKKFKPDIVILGVFLGNDITDDWPIALGEKINNQKITNPYVTFEGEVPKLVPHNLPPTPPLPERFSPTKVSYLFRFLRALQTKGLVALKEGTGVNTPGEFPNEYKILLPPDNEWRRAWEHNEKLIREFKKVVTQNGGIPLVMTVPGFIEQTPDQKTFKELLQKAYPKIAAQNPDPSSAVKRFLANTKNADIPTINLVPKFKNTREEIIGGTPKYGFSCDSHWNAEGHRLAAKEVASWIKKNLPEFR